MMPWETDEITWSSLPPMQGVRREERLQELHSNFNGQYQRLKQAAKEYYPKLYPFCPQLQGSRQAWDAAITTMRQLSRLEFSPKLIDALCFLSVSRSVAETAKNDRDTCMSSFSRDLKEWKEIFPELDKVTRFMWAVELDFVPELQSKADIIIEQLRASVAALMMKANKLFNLGYSNDLHSEIGGLDGPHQGGRSSADQDPPATEAPNAPATAREKEAPDLLIYSNTKSHGGEPPFFLTSTVRLVTSAIFAIVIYFIIGLRVLPPSIYLSTYLVVGFSYIAATTILGFPNPWQDPMSQTTTLETSSSLTPTPSPRATEPTIQDMISSGIEFNPLSLCPSQEPTAFSYSNTQAPDQKYFHDIQMQLPPSSVKSTIWTPDDVLSITLI